MTAAMLEALAAGGASIFLYPVPGRVDVPTTWKKTVFEVREKMKFPELYVRVAVFVRFTVVVAVLFTLPTTVIVTDAPGARLLNSVVTVFVEVLITAEPLVELALVRVREVGYVLRTTKVLAEVLPLLVTRTVKVKFWLTFAEVGLTEFVIAGLGVSVPVTVGVCGVPVTVAVRVGVPEVVGVRVIVGVMVRVGVRLIVGVRVFGATAVMTKGVMAL